MDPSIQCIVFNLYGTQLYLRRDTKPYLRMFRALEIDPLAAANVSLITDKSMPTLADMLKAGHGLDLSSLETDLRQDISSCVLYDGTRDTLDRLQAEYPMIKMGMISDAAQPYEKPFLDLGLDRYFTSPVFSFREGKTKGDGSLLLAMLARWGIAPESCLVVGNGRSDAESAKNACAHFLKIDWKNGIGLDRIFQPNEMYRLS